MVDSLYSYPCDICGADQPLSIDVAKIYTNNQSLYSCGNCGFVYVKDRRTAENIAKSWSDDIFQKGYTAKIPYVLGRQTYVADFIDTTIGLKGKKICDIGAGEGQFLDICRKKAPDIDIFGIEPSLHNVGLLQKQNVSAFKGTIENFKKSPEFNGKKFNIITIMWTLENCLDCNVMIKTAYEMLEDGGHIVVATGSRILVPFKKPLSDYLSTNPADTHSFRFSANSIWNILTKNNFSNIILNRYIDGEYLVAIGQKTPQINAFQMRKDDSHLIVEFFNRWHSDTEWFAKNNLLKIS